MIKKEQSLEIERLKLETSFDLPYEDEEIESLRYSGYRPLTERELN